MLAVSPLRNNEGNEREDTQMEEGNDDFSDLAGCDFLDSIDFDDLFINIGGGGEPPDLEMDPEIFAEFSVTTSSAAAEEEEYTHNSTADNNNNNVSSRLEATAVAADKTGGGLGSELCSAPSTKREERAKDDKVRKSTEQFAKNPSCKKKAKVDWTPELHRRFVQAVEQLGVDKAVPSRILELMGIDCLTRHNIASHLQKYRSHRKHLLAREAAAASWSHRRQMYGGGGGGGVGGKREAWMAVTPPPPPPIMGFPPPPPAAATPTHHFRQPLHVWGHPPPIDHHLHIWPKHPPHAWPPPHSAHHRQHPPALIDPSFWMSQHQHRFPSSVVAGIPPPPPAASMYRPEIAGKILPQVHPSKESLDEAIGHVLKKPWTPLPLGLKPPSFDSVMSELQRQGISKIPPAAAANLINSTKFP